jgi:hypothetical protein
MSKLQAIEVWSLRRMMPEQVVAKFSREFPEWSLTAREFESGLLILTAQREETH